jgi:two-component system, OmpR family, phosphate regulon response regulator PhoB
MKKVLIVDDCKEIRQLVATTLDIGEFTVYEASNGLKAVEMAKKWIPDLVIMDIAMPGSIDGIEATRQIKSTPATASCQVIILTGSRVDRQKDGLAAGACDVLTKPFSPLDLIGKVESILGIAV